MATGFIERLKTAIGYPDGVPDGASSFVFRVDGAEVQATESDDALLLVYNLDAQDDDLPQLADWAVGRMLREDAALSVTNAGRPFLWQEVPSKSGAAALRRCFETFMDSCDWWRARLEERSGDGAPHFPDVYIRP